MHYIIAEEFYNTSIENKNTTVNIELSFINAHKKVNAMSRTISMFYILSNISLIK